MILIDTNLWLEHFIGKNVPAICEKYFEKPESIITPTVIIYELAKKILLNNKEENLSLIIGQMNKTTIIDLNEDIAIIAAESSVKYKLPFADSIIYATAIKYNCDIATSDEHFRHLDKVVFFER